MLAKNAARTFCFFIVWLVPALAGWGQLSVSVADIEYEVKDLVKVEVAGAEGDVRLKVFGPDFVLVDTFELKVAGDNRAFLWQARKPGKYLVEATDTKADAFKRLEVGGKAPDDGDDQDDGDDGNDDDQSDDDDTPPPDRPSGLSGEIYDITKSVRTLDLKREANGVAKIFRSQASKAGGLQWPPQTLIQNTVDEVETFLGDTNSNWKRWKENWVTILEPYRTSTRDELIDVWVKIAVGLEAAAK